MDGGGEGSTEERPEALSSTSSDLGALGGIPVPEHLVPEVIRMLKAGKPTRLYKDGTGKMIFQIYEGGSSDGRVEETVSHVFDAPLGSSGSTERIG